MDKYTIERDGQIEFFKSILPRVNPALDIEEILADNNDGVINGNLLEFKLHVSDLNAVLFQCVKYLSAIRVRGKPVPAGVVMVDLNAAVAYYYESAPYITAIEKLYSGGASKDNSGFTGGAAVHTLRYGTKPLDTEKLVGLLKETKFTKININEDCVVGWATSFYKAVPNARKEDFLGDDKGKHKTIGEIRKPRVFAEFIHPYVGETNVKFNYLMDKLNDFLLKKNLGAFYTPPQYVEKALELVRKAIARVPAGNDYIILDRCAGTGNLESKMTDEELSHCIVSTVEYYEYKVLQELIGSKVRHIIPPIETADTFNAGLVTGADALSSEYIDNAIIKQYLDNSACTVILFENPPYEEVVSSEIQKRGESHSTQKNSFVIKQMKEVTSGVVSRDLGNAFIWSGFKYYLRQPTDSYIVFSPVKYWKVQHLVNKQFIDGFAFNRRHFHTTIEACIMCALWANIDDNATNEFSLTGYDIIDNKLAEHAQKLPVKRIFDTYSAKYFDKRTFADDEKSGILCALNGTTEVHGKITQNPIYNENILGYLSIRGAGFDNPDLNVSLLRGGRYDGGGFFLRKDNYLEKLPMFAASRYITYNREWTERARIMKSADGAKTFNRDVKNGKLSDYLLKCLLFTCLEMQNHMRTFTGSDGRFYRNELCLDGTNGDTIALRDIAGLVKNAEEQALIWHWENVLLWAKQAENYNPALTYGVYQIYSELDTSHKDEKTDITVYDNVELHSALTALKGLVKAYYNAEIVPILFEYEFLK